MSRFAKLHTVENELVLFGSSRQCQMGSTRIFIQFRVLYELQVHFTKAGNEGIVQGNAPKVPFYFSIHAGRQT